MSFFILKIRLAFYLFSFFLDLSAHFVQHIRPALWSFVLFLLLLCGVGLNIQSVQAQIFEEQITRVVIDSQTPHEDVVFTRTNLEEKLEFYKVILQQQPQHRDVLINSSLLERAIHNQKDSFLYWEEARELDPNNKIFLNN